MSLHELLDSGGVKRFHTIPSLPAQTIAEHSWRVAMVARHLWGPPTAREWQLYLTHDCGELETGDAPAPFKWGNPEAAQLFNETEHEARVRLGVELENVVALEHSRLKIADGFELMLTMLDERRRGNQNADEVFLRIGQRVADLIRSDITSPAKSLFNQLFLDYSHASGRQGERMLIDLSNHYILGEEK